MNNYQQNDWVLFNRNGGLSFGHICCLFYYSNGDALVHLEAHDGLVMWVDKSAVRGKCTPDGCLLEESKAEFNVVFDEMREI